MHVLVDISLIVVGVASTRYHNLIKIKLLMFSILAVAEIMCVLKP